MDTSSEKLDVEARVVVVILIVIVVVLVKSYDQQKVARDKGAQWQYLLVIMMELFAHTVMRNSNTSHKSAALTKAAMSTATKQKTHEHQLSITCTTYNL